MLKSKKKGRIYKGLEESLKEVKLIKEGKIKPKKWRELLKEIKEKEKRE